MTQPRTESITITRGDDYGATFTFDVAVANFSEMRFTVRESWATTEADNTEATLTTTLTPTGTYTADLALTSAQALGLTYDLYMYDVQVTTLAGKLYTTQRGQLRVNPDVTR